MQTQIRHLNSVHSVHHSTLENKNKGTTEKTDLYEHGPQQPISWSCVTKQKVPGNSKGHRSLQTHWCLKENFHVTLPGPRILKWAPDFCKICGQLTIMLDHRTAQI